MKYVHERSIKSTKRLKHEVHQISRGFQCEEDSEMKMKAAKKKTSKRNLKVESGPVLSDQAAAATTNVHIS